MKPEPSLGSALDPIPSTTNRENDRGWFSKVLSALLYTVEDKQA